MARLAGSKSRSTKPDAKYPSGELVMGVVERAHDRAIARFRALDIKAATLITFAGALVALGKDLASPWKALCVLFAVLSGLSALTCYWPRGQDTIDPTVVEKYMKSQPADATYHVTRALVAASAVNEKSAKAKGMWLRISLGLLGATAVMYGVGIVNPHFQEGNISHVNQHPSPVSSGPSHAQTATPTPTPTNTCSGAGGPGARRPAPVRTTQAADSQGS